MTKLELLEKIIEKQSFLCIGLDPDLSKIPSHLLEFEDPIFEFNKRIIDATKDLCIAYKPNTAFYECYGSKGWESFEKTVNYIPKDCFIIADAKRGDIGNTSRYYAKTFFETYACDAITVAPYMGSDSVMPFIENHGKWAVILALTSNEGSFDFQFKELRNGRKLYETVIEKAKEWGSDESLMFVVGATRVEEIENVRKLAPNHFFLVPGVGEQGGSLSDVVKYGANNQCGLIVSSSREIIYASNKLDFELSVKSAAKKLQAEMAYYIQQYKW
jgi:orotidine-5'-phosphate decarboxylase